MSDSEYDFEYSDEEDAASGDSADYAIENQYYQAKTFAESNDNEQALDTFLKIIETDKASNYQNSDWGFKALKQVVHLLWQARQHEELMEKYGMLLEYVVQGRVTRNLSEEAINGILDLVSASVDSEETQSILLNFYNTTLAVLRGSTATDRLWFKTLLKLGYLHLQTDNLVELTKAVKELHLKCSDPATGELDEHRKGSQLLELYALQIQLYTKQKDNRKLREIYERALLIKSAAIPHPKVHAIIRECGGKMHMLEKSWEKARTDFFEAFRNYDQAGDARRISCLKYLVLANMLTGSEINPFEGQETKPFEHHSEIKVMTSLVDAFLHNEVAQFEAILKRNSKVIMEDVFISLYINDLLKTIRGQVVTKMIKPYTSISLQYIADNLAITVGEVEELLVSLILDERIKGKIDQKSMVLNLAGDAVNRKHSAIQDFTKQLNVLCAGLTT